MQAWTVTTAAGSGGGPLRGISSQVTGGAGGRTSEGTQPLVGKMR